MKRFGAALIAFLVGVSLCACGSSAQQPQATQQPTEPVSTAPKTLKVLAIGNSFSVDAMTHLYQVAKSEGVEEVVLGNLFYGGCTLKQHAGFMESGEGKYRYEKCVDGIWINTEGTSLLTGLQDEAWDVITMQQGSYDSGIVDTFQPSLDKLIAYVQENKTNPDAKLLWHMTWAYQSDSDHEGFAAYGNNQQTMYYGIVNALQKVIDPNESIQGTIPVGTAIQNLRSSVIGDTLTRDGYHLNDLGRVTAAYTWYACLADQEIQSVKFSVVGKIILNDQQKDLIVKAVNAALKKPQAVTSVY